MDGMIAVETLYIDKKGKVTTDEAKADRLLCREGCFVSIEWMLRYGLKERWADAAPKEPMAVGGRKRKDKPAVATANVEGAAEGAAEGAGNGEGEGASE